MSAVTFKDIIKQEYSKCYASAAYFMKRYCYIQHPKKGKIKFNLYDFQVDTLDQLQNNTHNIINKGRQLGISTLSAGFSLWLMTFHNDKNILVIATKQEVAKNLVTKVTIMYDYLPSWLKVDYKEKNKLSLSFKNGSLIKASSSAEDAGRSEALSMLIIDEAAFMKNAKTIWTAAQSTLSTGGSAIILSTPNGTGNFFHEMWVDATEGNIDFNTITLHWSVHPERDQEWRDGQTKLLGEKLASQENDCDFITSGHTVVDGATLKFYEENHVTEPIEKRGLDGGYHIFEYPQAQKSYAVVADVARGDGEDYSAFHVFDIETCEQVAEFKGKIGTTDYGNMLVAVSTEYNDALLVIENANIGWAVLQIPIDRKYSNLYYSYKDTGYYDAETYITKGYDLKDKSEMVPGFTTSTRTRPLLISKLEHYFRERTVVIRGQRTITELFTFAWIGQKAQAQPGYNDDLSMSLGIFLYIRDSAIRLKEQGLSMQRQTLSTMGDVMATVGLYKSTVTNAKKSWEVPSAHGEKMDLTDFL